MNDYSGRFDPAFHLGKLSRSALANLGREYMLFGHLINRAGLPLVHMRLGPEAREKIAIDLWMGASPVYTRWMQKALRFQGDDVATIFKGFQLDVGFAHQYMDVRYQLESAEKGLFWLQSCGALLQIEPFGEAAVISMCHHIEDPTFDASAVATNPRARCRPIHRPPRLPADRVPHCHWSVFIDHDAEPIQQIPLTTRMGESRLARIGMERSADAEPGGWADYGGPFDPDFQLEDLSHSALVLACRGFLLQDQLLVRAMAAAVAERADEAAGREIALGAWLGCGPVASRRVRDALRIPGDDAEAIVKVLQVHPAFLPGYASLRFALDGRDRARLAIADCDALNEAQAYGWSALLGDGAEPALDAMVQAVNPRARCVAVTPAGSERLAWEVRIDPSAEPAGEPVEASMVTATGTAQFAFTRRRPLRG
jgi:hypothetical protein